jgi:putative transposase
MPLLTLRAQIHATPEVEPPQGGHGVLPTKVYNGLRHLREAYKGTGKVDLSRKNLNRIKELPRAKDTTPVGPAHGER